MSEVDREKLKQWKSYITGILRPRYIHGFLAEFLSQVKVEEILSLEEKSCTNSAILFFENLVRLEQVGWYQAFLDQLRASGYTGLHYAIENVDFSQIENLREYKELLILISPTIVSNIKPNEVLNSMQCLLPREYEEIRKVSEHKGDIAGAEKLLECLQRSDKPQFFKEFQFAMETYDYNAVTILLSSKADDLSNSSVKTESVMDYSEQPEDMDTCSAPIIHTPNSQQNSNDIKQFELRAYQEELAESAIDGDNTIICAPTGSGKTIVALHIVERHLMERPDQDKGKVGFMATTVPVFQQQLELFKKHFGMTKFKVYGICGDLAASCPVEMFVEKNDIIILTPQILLNCLKYGQISSLSAFTLLIFDECHNTTKNHPYNVLMSKYEDLKLGLVASAVPQIVGLTASIGVGDAGSVKDAMGYIMQICANLDAENISTVNRNVEGLKEHVYSAIKETRKAAMRTKNPFADIIRQIMVQVEDMAKSIYDIDNLSNIKNQNRGSQKYEQWIIEVQKRCKVLQMKDMEKERRTCRALFTYTEHLRKYNDALIINDDARTKDAVEYLKSFFDNVKGGGYDETEQILTALFEAKEEQILRIDADPTNENPKLTEVRKILTEEYQHNPMTKTIMFVRTRALADALKNWLKESEMLSYLQPGLLVGRAKSTGMTLPSQKDVLTSFRNDSGNKILVATSVADEGIDIANCNLVLLYEYVGNVIKMIQTRGRGRAQDSKCILVTSKEDQIEKEMVNSAQETMMYKAIKDLQQLDRTTFIIKKNMIQAEEKRMERKINENTDKAAESYKLLCAKCKIYACLSDDIRKIEGSHHVVIDKSFSDRYQTRPHRNPVQIGFMQKREKLHCKDCSHSWGITANFNPFKDLPVIKCDSFVFHHVSSGSPQIVKKWKDVPFLIKKFEGVEYRQETK